MSKALLVSYRRELEESQLVAQLLEFLRSNKSRLLYSNASPPASLQEFLEREQRFGESRMLLQLESWLQEEKERTQQEIENYED